eukprot:TRINITY_DN2211_c0_g1_i2.p1 TRINITY_DN2211_c0_g1~~TRINITY_DN2211_c0_g1_i2.p1  ORF type:complete len:657 (+),score=147.57 TRINITY_DN2211_c0_g1_i2:94-1971(+)
MREGRPRAAAPAAALLAALGALRPAAGKLAESIEAARKRKGGQLTEEEMSVLIGSKVPDELFDSKTGKRIPLHPWARPQGQGANVPDQLRLALAPDPARQITVSWVTYAAPTRPYVRYAALTDAAGAELRFGVGGRAKLAHVTNLTRQRVNIEEYVMRITLDDLQPNTTYLYVVGDYWPDQHAGSRGALGDLQYFRTMPAGHTWSPRLLMFGDLAVDSALPAALITKMVKEGKVDAVFHAGDIAYSLVKNSGTYGDRWMRAMAPFASSVPYMVTPGDHDLRWGVDTWDMQQRFAMPGWRTVAGHPGAVLGRWGGLWWSVDVGPVHIASYNTEMWMTHNDLGIVKDGYNWLRNDLRKANANRDKVPWIITIAHTPMYTSGYRKRRVRKDPRTGKNRPGTSYTQNFDPLAAKHRRGPLVYPGYNGTHPFHFETLLYDMKVDLAIQAHWHNYERFLPVFKGAYVPGPHKDPYTDPQAPVHINVGHAGRGHEPFDQKPLPFSARRQGNRGFGVLTFKSDRELVWTAYDCSYDNCRGDMHDFFILRKTKGREAPYDPVGPARPQEPPPRGPAAGNPFEAEQAAIPQLRRRESDAASQVEKLRAENKRLKDTLKAMAEEDPRFLPRGGIWK